jgi:hypothetical protein
MTARLLVAALLAGTMIALGGVWATSGLRAQPGAEPRPSNGQGNDKDERKRAATKLKVFVPGVCRNKEDKKPVVNAVVQFHIYRENPRRMEVWKTTRTDLDGLFTLEGDFPSDLTDVPQLSKISVRASGRASNWFYWQPDAKYKEPVERDLAAPAKLEGRVVDAECQPVAGAHVTVGSEPVHGINDAVSSKDGRFVIDDMGPWDAKDEPAWSNGACVTGLYVHARHTGYPKWASATFDRVPASRIEIRFAKK